MATVVKTYMNNAEARVLSTQVNLFANALLTQVNGNLDSTNIASLNASQIVGFGPTTYFRYLSGLSAITQAKGSPGTLWSITNTSVVQTSNVSVVDGTLVTSPVLFGPIILGAGQVFTWPTGLPFKSDLYIFAAGATTCDILLAYS